MRYSLCLAFLSLLALSGCSAYVGDRLKDASEIIDVGLGLSVGLEANARATKMFQLGIGSYSGDWMGLKEGRLALWREERSELGIAPLYFHEVFRTSDTLLDIRHPLILDPGYGPYLNDLGLMTDRGFFEVGGTVNFIVAGMDTANLHRFETRHRKSSTRPERTINLTRPIKPEPRVKKQH